MSKIRFYAFLCDQERLRTIFKLIYKDWGVYGYEELTWLELPCFIRRLLKKKYTSPVWWNLQVNKIIILVDARFLLKKQRKKVLIIYLFKQMF